MVNISFTNWAGQRRFVGPEREISCLARRSHDWSAEISRLANGDIVLASWRDSTQAGIGKLRRAVRTRGHFPADEAAMKLLCLVLRQVARKWKMLPREWCEAKTQFAIMFDERFVTA
jgi:hypothetical protein